jgi:hypothetical protein|tara:strand:+ start:13249 stop:13710 length:462 start_codon:yes stop_codon:yes gene_type:complete
MKNISVFVQDLSVSQKSFYLIKEFNRCLDDTDVSTSVFVERPSIPPITPCFSCRSVAFLSGYNGTVIATTIDGADKILKATNASSKYLYLWDMEWLETPMYFAAAMRILRDDRLKLIARSQSHAELIESFCNKKPVAIISDWNMNELLEVTVK